MASATFVVNFCKDGSFQSLTMATTPVIGIDFGNENCYIGVARAGGIEIIINDYSQRNTPTCVAFTTKNRMMGTSAKNQVITNIRNTVFAFKRLIGLKFTDPLVAEEQKYVPYTLLATADGEVGFQVSYLGEDTVFSVRQVVAMQLTKLKEVAETALECKVFECVLAVPYFFTESQRRALHDAASIANLQVLRLMNEPSSAAVAYGLYRTSTDLPNTDQPPKHVAFVDFGSSALQVAISAFHKGKVKMLATSFDPTLGGRCFDTQIAHQLAKPFNKPGSDVTQNKRSWIRLLAEVDKLKRQMSANTSKLPINIECLIEERDFSSSMKRSEMEELCAPLFERVEKTLRQCLESSGLKPEDISEIELIGGMTRMPALKALVEKVYGKAPATTLNQDECIARGAAIMAAMLSPNFKVKEFALTDLQPYAISLHWGGVDVEQGDLEVFPKFHAVPFSKMLTFYRKGPFMLTARYADPEVARIQNDNIVGEAQIMGVKSGAQGEAQKVKVKVRVNLHGVFQVVQATLMEKQGSQNSGENMPEPVQAEPEGMDTDAATEVTESAAAGESAKMDTNGSDASDAAAAAQNGDKADKPSPPKQVVKSVELQVDSKTSSLPLQSLQDLTESEVKCQSVDREERDRIDSKNTLEEFVLSIRSRVNDSDDLEPYVEASVRDEIVQLANNIENWLYDEGEDCKKNEYVQKLDLVKDMATPAQNRKRDHEGTPRAAEQYAASLNRYKKALSAHLAGDVAYDHWTPEEVSKMEGAIAEKSTWLDSNVSKIRATLKTKDLPIKAAAFISEQQAFESSLNAVLNKPKPQPPAPPAPEATPAADKTETAPTATEDKMETD